MLLHPKPFSATELTLVRLRAAGEPEDSVVRRLLATLDATLPTAKKVSRAERRAAKVAAQAAEEAEQAEQEEGWSFWLSVCCVWPPSPGVGIKTTSASVLYASYVRWMDGGSCMSFNKFGRRMTQIGVTRFATMYGVDYNIELQP